MDGVLCSTYYLLEEDDEEETAAEGEAPAAEATSAE